MNKKKHVFAVARGSLKAIGIWLLIGWTAILGFFAVGGLSYTVAMFVFQAFGMTRAHAEGYAIAATCFTVITIWMAGLLGGISAYHDYTHGGERQRGQ